MVRIWIAKRIFQGDPVDVLKKMDEAHSAYKNGDNIESNIQEAKMGEIQGKNVTLTITSPKQIINGYELPETQMVEKNFVWEDDGISYALCYSKVFMQEGKTANVTEISQDEVDKIFSSIKSLDELNNVDYTVDLNEGEELSTETGIMSIYDKDDIKKAEEILGFSPNMPLIINSINIQDSIVGLTSDSNVENNNINYELNNFYKDDKNMMTFSQSKHDTFNRYTSAKDKGYIYMNETNINTEKSYIDGNEVYRHMEKDIDQENFKETISVDYFWQKDDIYYTLTIFNTDGYHDEIAKEFINSKTID